MKHQLHSSKNIAAIKADALIFGVSEAYQPGKDAIGKLIAQALAAKDFTHAKGSMLRCYQAAGLAARTLLVVGTGKGTPTEERAAAQTALAQCSADGIASIALAGFAHVGAALQGASDSCYRYDTTVSKKKTQAKQSLHFYSETESAAEKLAFAQAVAMAEGVALAKEMGNRPANYATPAGLAAEAQKIAKGSAAISCKVLGKREVEALKMGSFLSVAQASTEPLKFIQLQYKGAAKAAPVVLVGKGITFDTGGISLKPGAAMDEMKYDMCGAASVLGVFKALALLRPAINVVGLIPSCENMPAGNATKPGDVVTAMDGSTIEILNTDAEGRLILCDALTYAARFKPAALVDIATLTGACVIALGGVRSGLFSNDEVLAAQLSAAGQRTLDYCWRMPLDDEYAEALKSRFADVANVGDRAAGSVTAAKFLQRFVGETPWAHLDIAGTAWKSGAAKGATGRPVRLLLQYLLDLEVNQRKAKAK